MKKEFTSGESWNNAAIAGLIMAIVTIAADLIAALCGKVGGVAGGFLNFIVWAGKIALCAFTFRYLMLRFKASYEGVDYPRLQRYGLKLALFSSILVSAYTIANLLLINPDTMTEIMETARTSYASMMDSNTEAVFEKMLPKMPYYMAIGSFIYCFIWGWLFSTLFARSAAPSDPFADTEENNS